MDFLVFLFHVPTFVTDKEQMAASSPSACRKTGPTEPGFWKNPSSERLRWKSLWVEWPRPHPGWLSLTARHLGPGCLAGQSAPRGPYRHHCVGGGDLGRGGVLYTQACITLCHPVPRGMATTP